MAFRNGKIIITGGPTTTTSTSIFTLASVDGAAMPGGIGALTGRTNLSMRVIVMLMATGVDHNSVHWEHAVQASYVSSLSVMVLDEAISGNFNVDGRVGDSNTSTISFDTSGTTLRVRITPDSTNSYAWYCKIECNFMENT